jgi:hypothetical protein
MNLLGGYDSLSVPHTASDLQLCKVSDRLPEPCQHMLMAELSENFDRFLLRVVRQAIPRLIKIEDGPPPEDDKEFLLASLRMGTLLRAAVDQHIHDMVVTAGTDRADVLLSRVLGLPEIELTWKEIGEALGVSAQAVHRKYAKDRATWPASGGPMAR